jgi:selenide,water dikinase
MIEAGCTVIGGHSIRDEETKFGYSVTGLIHPKKIYQNQGAKPGDKLILTKALGTGVISTAIKQGKAQQGWIDAATQSMTTLNKKAAEVIGDLPNARRLTPDAESPVHAMTDITGFGLIGHLREILLASNVSARIYASRIPQLPGALECIRAGHIPGGLNNNRNFAECMVEYDNSIPEDIRALLYDPQTAGGLLISVATNGIALADKFTEAGIPAVEIGKVLPLSKPQITITK